MKQQGCKASNRRPLVALAVGIAFTGLLCGVTETRAGLVPVAPDQSSLLAGSAYQPPVGSIVAQQSTPFAAWPYQTSVAGQLQFEPTSLVRRSADESSFRFDANGPGLGGAPELAVKTNASRFDANGIATYSLADVFQFNGPHGQELDNVWDAVAFKNTFHPIGPAATGGTAVAVPLPPTFYTGLGIMMACGVITLVRRFMGS